MACRLPLGLAACLAPLALTAPLVAAPLQDGTCADAPSPAPCAEAAADPSSCTVAAAESAEPAAVLTGLLDRDDLDTRLVRCLLSDLYLADGDIDQAASTLEGLAGAERDAEVQVRLGRVYRRAADDLLAQSAAWEDIGYFLELARAAFETASDVAAPGDTRAAVELIDIELYAYGDSQAALALADATLADHPDCAETRLLRGCASMATYWGSYEQRDWAACDARWAVAEEDLRAAADALPADRTEPFAELVWLYAQRADRSGEAVDAAIEVLDRAPETPIDDLYYLATAYARAGDHAAAARALLALAERRPAELTARVAAEDDITGTAKELSYASLNHHVIDRGELEKGRTVYAVLASAGPESADFFNNYGLLCRDTGSYEESYRAYCRSVELDGTDPRVLNDTALVLHYHLAGDDADLLQQARNLYEQSISLAADSLADEEEDPSRRAYLAGALVDASNNLVLLKAAQAYGALDADTVGND